MVDFSQLLKDSSSEKDENILTGTMTALVGRNEDSLQERKCQWEIGSYPSSQGEWITFRITEGGVTGYESFVIRDERGLNAYTLDPPFVDDPMGVWHACAGGMGWNVMILRNTDVRMAVQQWLDREGLKYPE